MFGLIFRCLNNCVHKLWKWMHIYYTKCIRVMNEDIVCVYLLHSQLNYGPLERMRLLAPCSTHTAPDTNALAFIIFAERIMRVSRGPKRKSSHGTIDGSVFSACARASYNWFDLHLDLFMPKKLHFPFFEWLFFVCKICSILALKNCAAFRSDRFCAFVCLNQLNAGCKYEREP